MTSQITTDNIDALYPVAGQDNDSQGFRDNFNAIKEGLLTAKGEITQLQTNSILSASLADVPAPVDNDLLGSSINNGYYNNFHGVLYVPLGSVSSQTDIDITAGSIQSFTLNADPVTFTFKNWPDLGYYANIRVHFQGQGNGAFTADLYSEGGGTIIKDINFPSSFATGFVKNADGIQSQSSTTLVLADVDNIEIGQTVIKASYLSSGCKVIGVDRVAKEVTLSSAIIADIADNATITFSYASRVIEAWTVDGGANVYVKHIGDF